MEGLQPRGKPATTSWTPSGVRYLPGLLEDGREEHRKAALARALGGGFQVMQGYGFDPGSKVRWVPVRRFPLK